MDEARRRMIDRQVVGRGITDAKVIDALGAVRREDFLPDELKKLAYEDRPLPIGEAQTISQPYVVALMIEAAQIRTGDTVLEVGAGSGYAAAVMGRIASRVFAIERLPGLVDKAQGGLAVARADNVEIRLGDGTMGWPDAAPFDAIVVSAGGPTVPRALTRQLRVGGRLVIPVGTEPGAQRLLRIRRVSASEFAREDLGGVLFVPLIGEGGWTEDLMPAMGGDDEPSGLTAMGASPVPREPNPSPGPPPPGLPIPPVEEPEPWRLPDEEPVPNPDENDSPPKHAH